jgi:hypothetical protein
VRAALVEFPDPGVRGKSFVRAQGKFRVSEM